MDLTEIVAWRASESLVFVDLLCTDNAGRKKRNFNCRWGTKIVDISQYFAKLFFLMPVWGLITIDSKRKMF
ncbi:hypothetical protein DRN43_06985 [Thermococci archaeon]|nr:MAG: hypothetical protein DRN43_06985 [Thermococci archaeon]